MIPEAYISHQIPNRIRLRIPAERNKNDYFSKIEKELQKLKGVDRVEVQPLTGSILIEHTCPVRTLADFTREHQLFEMREPKAAEPWLETLLSKVDRWDEELRHSTQGQWDIYTLMAAGVAGVSVYQAFRKRFLPPAWTLLGNAFTLLNQSRSELKARKFAA